jgi:hypothetical protein
MSFPIEAILSLLPVVASALSPYVTEGVKKAVAAAGAAIPAVFKPAVSILAGAALAAVCGGEAAVGGVVGLASSLGFKVGKSS